MVFMPCDYQGLVVAQIAKLESLMDTHLPRTCSWVEGFPSWLLPFRRWDEFKKVWLSLIWCLCVHSIQWALLSWSFKNWWSLLRLLNLLSMHPRFQLRPVPVRDHQVALGRHKRIIDDWFRPHQLFIMGITTPLMAVNAALSSSSRFKLPNWMSAWLL